MSFVDGVSCKIVALMFESAEAMLAGASEHLHQPRSTLDDSISSLVSRVKKNMHPVQNQPNCGIGDSTADGSMPTTLKTGWKTNVRSFLPSNSPFIYMRSSILLSDLDSSPLSL